MLADRFIASRPDIHSDLRIPSLSGCPYEDYIRRNMVPEERLLNFSGRSKTAESIDGSPIRKANIQANVLNPTPDRVLDAPGVLNDFYLSLMDWSERGPLVIALANEVYAYTPQDIAVMCKASEGCNVTSVRCYDGVMAVGFSDASVRVYDLEKQAMFR